MNGVMLLGSRPILDRIEGVKHINKSLLLILVRWGFVVSKCKSLDVSMLMWVVKVSFLSKREMLFKMYRMDCLREGCFLRKELYLVFLIMLPLLYVNVRVVAILLLFEMVLLLSLQQDGVMLLSPLLLVSVMNNVGYF